MKRVPISLTSPLGERAWFVWESEDFSAALFSQDSVLRLSIARNDLSDLPMSWEDLMKVKRDCGYGNVDALEVYPSDSDIFNTGNIRHLYLTGPVEFALRRNSHVLQPSNPTE